MENYYVECAVLRVSRTRKKRRSETSFRVFLSGISRIGGRKPREIFAGVSAATDPDSASPHLPSILHLNAQR